MDESTFGETNVKRRDRSTGEGLNVTQNSAERTDMDLVASEVMRRDVKTVHPEMLLPELERTFAASGLTGFPVVDERKVVGVVSRSDIVQQLYVEHAVAVQVSDYYRDADGIHELPLNTPREVAGRVGERMEQLSVRDVMHRRVFAVPPDQPMRSVAQTMTDEQIHRVLVTRDGSLLGIISAMDIVRLYARGRLRPG
jgi:CBS domain-containing protein